MLYTEEEDSAAAPFAGRACGMPGLPIVWIYPCFNGVYYVHSYVVVFQTCEKGSNS